MSAGSEFHATGPEKLKARSLNLVRRRDTTNFGAEHAAERSPDVMEISHFDGCEAHITSPTVFIVLTCSGVSRITERRVNSPFLRFFFPSSPVTPLSFPLEVSPLKSSYGVRGEL